MWGPGFRAWACSSLCDIQGVLWPCPSFILPYTCPTMPAGHPEIPSMVWCPGVVCRGHGHSRHTPPQQIGCPLPTSSQPFHTGERFCKKKKKKAHWGFVSSSSFLFLSIHEQPPFAGLKCVFSGNSGYLMKAPWAESKSFFLLRKSSFPTLHPAGIKGNSQPWLSVAVVMEMLIRMGSSGQGSGYSRFGSQHTCLDA